MTIREIIHAMPWHEKLGGLCFGIGFPFVFLALWLVLPN